MSSFISLPCLILGVPVRGCLGGHSCVSCLFLVVCSRAERFLRFVLTLQLYVGAKLCNLCAKKKC